VSGLAPDATTRSRPLSDVQQHSLPFHPPVVLVIFYHGGSFEPTGNTSI